MALTTKVFPIKPVAPLAGGQTTFGLLTLPMTAAAILEGDVIIEASGLALKDADGDAAKDVIVGFAAGTVASGASAIPDTVMFYPAWPGAFFEGNMIGGTNTDYSCTDASKLVASGLIYATVVTGVNPKAYCCIDTANTTNTVIHPLYFTRQRNGVMGVRSGFSPATVLNPRAAFVVRSSVFNPLA